MIFETMIKEVRDRIGDKAEFDMADAEYDATTVGNFWKNDFIERQLQEGNRRFNREKRWPWLIRIQEDIPVAPGQTEIELIDDVDLSRHMLLYLTKDSNPDLAFPVKKISPYRGLYMKNANRNAAVPKYYYVTRGLINTTGAGEDIEYAMALRIRLLPVAKEAMTGEFSFFKNPEIMTQLMEPEMPEVYHEAIVAWATAQCFLKEISGATNKAQEQFNLYNMILQQAVIDYSEPANDQLVIWGGEEPEYGENPRTWRERHLPQNIGL